MAEVITFDAQITATCYIATSGGTVFTNKSGVAAFDYFPNNAQVGDAVYFAGYSANPSAMWHDIHVNIGTAFAATSVTFVWEYSKGSGTWGALTVTDGTSNWTALGAQVVAFSVPSSDWTTNTVNAISDCWVRCRISAVNTPTEGGANSTTAVKVKNFGVQISNPGATTAGFCLAAYNADVAGGWGVVHQLTPYAYRFDCHLLVGDTADASTTTITETAKYIEIEGGFWNRKANSVVQLGTLIDATTKATKDGCYLRSNKKYIKFFGDTGNGSFEGYFYGCIIKSNIVATDEAYHTIYEAGVGFFGGSKPDGTGTTLYSNYYPNQRPDPGQATITSGASIVKCVSDGLVNNGMTRGVWNMYVRDWDGSAGGYTYFTDSNAAATYEYDICFIDPIATTYNSAWATTTSSRGGNYIYRMHTLNIKVTDECGNAIQNAQITLKDKDGIDSWYVEKGRVSNFSGTSDTTLTVDTDVWSVGDKMKAGGEIITIASGSYPNYTVTRSATPCDQASRQVQRLYPVVATDSSGLSGEGIITTEWYKRLTSTTTTTTVHNPFTLTITAPGFETYKSTITLAGKTAFTVAMKAKNYNVSSMVKV